MVLGRVLECRGGEATLSQGRKVEVLLPSPGGGGRRAVAAWGPSVFRSHPGEVQTCLFPRSLAPFLSLFFLARWDHGNAGPLGV